MSRPSLFTGDYPAAPQENYHVPLAAFSATSPAQPAAQASVQSVWAERTVPPPAEYPASPNPFNRPAYSEFTSRADSGEARQEDIDYREGQLNARMAQFENLVRNTKVSLQAKMDEMTQREDKLRESEEYLQSHRTILEEQFARQRREMEHDQIDLQTRKQAVEDRLVRREKELAEITAEREREIALQAEEYRQQLETQLLTAKNDYQTRFDVRCREIENEYLRRFTEEKKQLETQQRNLEESIAERSRQINRESDQQKAELEERFKNRFEELERQFSVRKKEADESAERRVATMNEDYLQKRNEMEERYTRREEQVERREELVRQAEEEWNSRRESFENQWNDFENLRKTKLEELSRREAQSEERERSLAELEPRLKRKELELAAAEEALKQREYQTALEAKKYLNLQEMMVSVEESQAEASRIREALIRERHQMQKTNEAERKRLRDAQELALKRLEEERQGLVSQSKRLEQMRLALDRSREDLGKMHRETLEIRLATEELWLRLAGESGTEDLKKSVGKIQARLASEYQDAISRLEIQKQELKQQKDVIRDQETKLTERKAEVDHLAAQTETMISEKEQNLKMREEELERRQRHVDDQTRKLQQDRSEMEHEVRMLQAQIDAAFGKAA